MYDEVKPAINKSSPIRVYDWIGYWVGIVFLGDTIHQNPGDMLVVFDPSPS